MKLEQQIEQELKKIGAINTLEAIKKLQYLNHISDLMQNYSDKRKGQLYVPPFCTDCKSKYATNQKGWGSAL
jgi:hypothetical protein